MKVLINLIICLLPFMMIAQSVGINDNGNTPDESAILDISSSSKGLLIPRLTTAQRLLMSPIVVGLTVFDMNTYSYWMYRGDVNGGWSELQHTYQKAWESNGSNIYNLNTANVGIGTNNPTSTLSINAIDPTINLMNNGTSRGFLMLSDENMYMGTNNGNTNGNINFGTRGNIRMSLSPEGRFGIGIQDPVSKFQIASGSEASLNSHGYMMLGNENSTNLLIDNNEILARSNGAASNLYLQDAGGNVYIGEPSPFTSTHRLGVNGHTVITGNLRVGNEPAPSGYRMAVDGKIICTELMVRLVANWPDYVFANDYKLRKIDEVEEFILKNNHLPGIPSAKEMEKAGMNLGEMQKLQMEKIEELTLYVIELKKEIEKLKAQK
jgi:hypothetical protein